MSEVDVDAILTVVPMDAPLLPESPSPERRVYLAAALDHPEGSWSGAKVYASGSPTSGFSRAMTLPTESNVGRLMTPLASSPPLGRWDRATTMVVRMLDGELESRPEADVLAGSNHVFVTTGIYGAGEVIAFRDAELIATGKYALTHLLRGRWGTDDRTGGHGPGDRVVALDRFVASKDYTLSSHRRPMYFRVTPAHLDAAEVPLIGPMMPTSRPLMPYAVTRLAGTRAESGTLVLTWTRRSRLPFNIFDLDKGSPLGAPTEEYDVEVRHGATVVRTVTVDEPAYNYTSANQTTDGFVAGDSVTVYQLNRDIDRTGRGVPAVATF